MASRGGKFIFVVLITVILSACASSPNNKTAAQPPAPSLDGMLTQAAVDSKAGLSEKAISQLQNAAKLYPTDKKPWLQMAQIHYDKSNYGAAIINAQEALQRSPTETLANSIIAVSGLRLSTKALADLRTQNNLSGSVKSEAQDLAKLLRESLGESVLVPAHNKSASGADRRGSAPGKVNSNRRPVSSYKAPESKSKPTAEVVRKDNADPFGSLK